MSFKIGGFLNSLGADNQIDNSATTFANKQIHEQYEGGALLVKIERGDSQETFARRGLHDHAIAAGLDEPQANKFADHWTDKKTTLKHYVNGNSYPYTPTEFANLKTQGSATFDLSKQYDAEILADLNSRVEEHTPIKAEESFAYTPEERTAILQQQKGVSQNQSFIADKPEMMLTNGQTRDGKPLDAETALGRYIEKNYNQNGRVWGDKINEMVSLAKTQGVKVDLRFNEDGTALVAVNAADKQKLDSLFNQALGETIKGEKGSDQGQREGTRMLADQARVAWNSSVNTIEGTINFAIDLAMSEGAKMPMYSMLPEETKPHVGFSGAKSKYESELMRRNIAGKVDGEGIKAGQVIETGVTIAAPIVAGIAIKPGIQPQTLKTLGALPETSATSSTSILRNVSGGETTFDPVKLQKIQANLEKRGVAFVTGEEGERMATFYGAEALYIPDYGRPGIIVLGKNPSTTAVVEELIHLGQHRRLGWSDITGKVPELEVAAQEKLLKLGKKLDWSENEINRIKRALETWRKQQ
jgi:hypothetical protein